MSSPDGPQHDPQHGQQLDPLTGQPLHGGQQPQQSYGGLGYYPNAQHPPSAGYSAGTKNDSIGGLLGVLVGIVVLLSAGGIGLYFGLSNLTGPNQSPQPVTNAPQENSSTGSAAPSTTERHNSTESTKKSEIPDVDATISGWQPVADPKTSVAYDVPPEWKVESPSMLVGFEDEDGPRTAMHAVATYEDEACSEVRGSSRGHTGIMGELIEDAAPRKVAEVGVNLWAAAAAEVPKDDPSVPEPETSRISLADGTKAYKATVTITPTGEECSAPEMKFTTVSFTPQGGDGALLFVMYTDQGISDALSGDKADKVISTLRPVG